MRSQEERYTLILPGSRGCTRISRWEPGPILILWHSDHTASNSVIIPNNGIVSGFFRALFGLANKDQVDTGKAIVAAAEASGQDVAFDTYSNGVNAAGKVAQGMSAGDLQNQQP